MRVAIIKIKKLKYSQV